MGKIKSCPYCGSNGEYYPDSDGQSAAIYCENCPLGVEHSGMSFEKLATVWNNLPRISTDREGE